MLITQREDIVAEGWDGELRALIRQVGGCSNHSEGSLKKVEKVVTVCLEISDIVKV